MTGQIIDLQDGNRSAEAKIQNLKSRLDSELTAKDVLRKDLGNAKSDLHKVSLELERAKSSSQELVLERDQAASQVSKLKMELEQKCSEVHKLKLQLDLTLSDNEELRTKHGRLQEEHGRLQLEFAEHVQQLKDSELNLEHVTKDKTQAGEIARSAKTPPFSTEFYVSNSGLLYVYICIVV